ncbi:MAG: SET domain-containing protein [Patescibacteria group bacterium]|nr:SET domain-containing protein [Patescibacteria group bacterium]
MLLVKTTIGPSRVHGIGIFAAELIPKGTLMWKYVPGVDLALTQEEFAALPEPARAAIKNYSYRSKFTGRYIVPFDDSRFYNHSDTSNTGEGPLIDGESSDVALEDIQPGDEIFNDYRITDADFDYKMSHDVRASTAR